MGETFSVSITVGRVCLRHQYKSVLSKNFTPRRHRFSLLFHEVGHMQFSRAASQDLHPRVSHYHGLLELSRQLAVCRHGGPVVWPRLVGPHAWSNKSCTTYYLLWKNLSIYLKIVHIVHLGFAISTLIDLRSDSPWEIIGSMVNVCPGFITPTALFLA